MELKVKEFCVLDWTELLFFNGLFQNNSFKNHISQKIKLKYTCLKFEVPVFAAFFDWAFVVLCVWFYAWSKNKRKQPLTVTINKKTWYPMPKQN